MSRNQFEQKDRTNMNKQQVVIEEQGVGDATTGFTSSLKPEVTNGANAYMPGKIVDSSFNQATGKMETPVDRDGGPEKQPNDDCMPLSPNQESDTASYGDPQ